MRWSDAFAIPVGPDSYGLRPRPRATLVVYYDETCRRCVRTARWLDRLNWLGRVRFRPAAEHPTLDGGQYADIQSIRRDGKCFSGFSTCQAIARRIPLLWALCLLSYIPLVRRLGARRYRRLADGRSRAAAGRFGIGPMSRMEKGMTE